jgi:drug/metabolite transporter (DMT)-like permease
MTPVLLSLAASCCWGVADFVGGLQSKRVAIPVVLAIVEGTGLVLVLVVIAATGEPFPGGRAVVLSLVGGVAGVVALGCFYRALSIGTMSIVAPISATCVALPVLVGLATGDALHPLVALGLVVTVGGVLLASREEISEEERRGPNRPAILLALCSALGFGLYFVFADIAADGSVLWLLAVGRMVVLPFVAGIAVARGVALLPPVPDRPQLIVIGVVDLGATGLYGLATTRGALSIVAVVGSLYPVVTILLARGVLSERLSQVQGAGVVAALAGVALVSAG